MLLRKRVVLVFFLFFSIEMMEDKVRQEEDEKRSKIDEAREKRRLEKERELERKRFDERLRVLNEQADQHCR
jgi:hypothetical protein